MEILKKTWDVIIVGGGNAALCSAITAAENGAKVLLLERAPEKERGGNSTFTEGLMRFVYNGADDIRKLCPDLTDAEMASADFGSYTEEQFFDDMARITQNRTDPDLCELLVRNSNPTLHWLVHHGIKFEPQFGRQAFNIDGKFKFWGGATLAAWGGGPGLVEGLYKAAKKAGVEVAYDAWVKDLLHKDGIISGVKVRLHGATQTINGSAVILACGGFEANAEWRSRYLGKGWDLAKVRVTRFNTGDGLGMALDIGAQPKGHWSGCHAVGWERYSSDFGDYNLTNDYERDSYPFSIIVNADGKRFLDEGSDFRNYTYAKYGRMILEQPSQFAWQIYDAKVLHLLRPEYRTKHVTKVIANSIEELVEKMEDVNQVQLLKTIHEFNASVQQDKAFNPNIKDGRCASNLEISKSNWANTIDTAPFHAYNITCGITFTFGGLKISNSGEVINTNDEVMPGLFAAGEMVGGLFYFNYPGATGLTSGAVFGQITGKSAAIYALS